MLVKLSEQDLITAPFNDTRTLLNERLSFTLLWIILAVLSLQWVKKVDFDPFCWCFFLHGLLVVFVIMIDGSENTIFSWGFNFRVRVLLKGVVMCVDVQGKFLQK